MLDTHARHLVQPLLDRTARILLNWGVQANHVTWFAFIIGISTGFFIILGLDWVAISLLWISGYLDAVDGSMARQERRTTGWGTLLDITFDRLVELSVIIGLAIRFPEATFMLLLLTASILFSMTVFLTVGALSEHRGIKSFYYQAGVLERTEGFILLTLMILLSKWLIWVTLVFFILETFTGLQRMLEARRLLKDH